MKIDKMEEPGFVFAPYVPLMTTNSKDVVEEVVTEEVLEVLPPSDDGSIQVGDGEGPAVLIPKVVEIKHKMPEFNSQAALMARYAQKSVDPNLYKKILISTT